MTHKKALHRHLALLFVVGTALLLAGCPTTPRRGGPPSVDRAEALTRAGDHAAAAAAYERLAMESTASADRAEFLLRAARAFFSANRPADADRVLALLPPGGLTLQQNFEHSLLRIQSAVAQGRGDEAWREVSSMPTPGSPDRAATAGCDGKRERNALRRVAPRVGLRALSAATEPASSQPRIVASLPGGGVSDTPRSAAARN